MENDKLGHLASVVASVMMATRECKPDDWLDTILAFAHSAAMSLGLAMHRASAEEIEAARRLLSDAIVHGFEAGHDTKCEDC